MDDNDLKEHLKTMNDRIYEQLSYAEAKNAVLIGFIGAAIFSIVGIIIELNSTNLLWLQIWLGVIAGSLLLPFILSLTSFYPNMHRLNEHRECNLFFYGDIAKFKDSDAYVEDINNSNSLNEQLAEQNIMVSNIVWLLNLKLNGILKNNEKNF